MADKKEEKNSNNKRIILRVTLLSVLVALFSWSYYQFSVSYNNIELSNRMIEALLHKKTALADKYARDLGLAKENLVQTEAFLKKVQEENDKLREKIKLLDKMAELEKTIARLKEKNALIINQMTSPQRDSTSPEKRFKTIEEGKAIIQDYQEMISKVKKKIKTLKKEEYEKKVAAQKEIDRIQTLLGNNGYWVRDGKLSPPDMPQPNANQNIKIDVEFVR